MVGIGRPIGRPEAPKPRKARRKIRRVKLDLLKTSRMTFTTRGVKERILMLSPVREMPNVMIFNEHTCI